MFEIGSSLRDARVRKGLDLTQLEAETKIRAKYLRALEEERFELLPGDTYVKGFLRIYADRLGLDGQLYMDEYNSRFSLGEEGEPVVAAGSRRRARHGRFEAHAVLVALAGIIAVTVFVIAAWQLGTGGNGETDAPATTASTTGVAGGAETVEPIDETPDPPPIELVVRAVRGSSKIVIRRASASGELVFEGTIRKGQGERFRGKRLWVFMARPDRIVLSLDGERAAGLSGREPGAVLASADGVRPVAR